MFTFTSAAFLTLRLLLPHALGFEAPRAKAPSRCVPSRLLTNAILFVFGKHGDPRGPRRAQSLADDQSSPPAVRFAVSLRRCLGSWASLVFVGLDLDRRLPPPTVGLECG